MDKYTAIKEAMDILCPEYDKIVYTFTYNANKYGSKSISTTGEDLIKLLSRKEYNLLELGYSASSISKLLKTLFPNRGSVCKPCTYILSAVGCKFCSYCGLVKPIEDFRKNSHKSSGVQALCKDCHVRTTAVTQSHRQSEYRASKINRTPKWADLAKIKEFYNKCPVGCHVDHIIPLNGVLASGLHTLENLQYLPASENCKKSNKFDI